VPRRTIAANKDTQATKTAVLVVAQKTKFMDGDPAHFFCRAGATDAHAAIIPQLR